MKLVLGKNPIFVRFKETSLKAFQQAAFEIAFAGLMKHEYGIPEPEQPKGWSLATSDWFDSNQPDIAVDAADATYQPASVSHLGADALPLAGITELEALFNATVLQASQTVLICGGSGWVAGFKR